MLDVTDATFDEEVVAASHNQPVVLDLWAPWCGPCKTLAPILEKVIAETDGAVLGAKVNIDENPQVARAMQAQSIPLVVAFVDGQAADGFLGAQGEPLVRDFIGKLLPDQTGPADAGPADAASAAPSAPTLTEPDSAEPAAEPAAPRPDFDLAEVEAQLATLLTTAKTVDADRQKFVELLELLGPEHPATAGWRKQLAAALY